MRDAVESGCEPVQELRRRRQGVEHCCLEQMLLCRDSLLQRRLCAQPRLQQTPITDTLLEAKQRRNRCVLEVDLARSSFVLDREPLRTSRSRISSDHRTQTAERVQGCFLPCALWVCREMQGMTVILAEHRKLQRSVCFRLANCLLHEDARFKQAHYPRLVHTITASADLWTGEMLLIADALFP